MRPEFAERLVAFHDALALFRTVRRESREARSRLLADIREGGLGAFFNAPEIRARSRARQAASAAAEALFMSQAENEAEAALQAEALSVFENELGGSPGIRERFPPSRRLSS